MELDDIRMLAELLKEHNLSVGPLGIGLVTECVEYFLESDHFLGLSVGGLPHDAVGALAESFLYLVALDDVILYLIWHCCVSGVLFIFFDWISRSKNATGVS